MKKIILLSLICLACTINMFADEFTGKVMAVIDGNTLEVTSSDNEVYKIMLAGIDSPELNQDFGDKAKKLLEKLTLKKNVTVKIIGKDRLGNRIAEVMVDGKLDPRIELLKQGLAWTAERDPLPDFEMYRTKAQQKGKGLWTQSDPTPPWIFRRQQTMLQPKSS